MENRDTVVEKVKNDQQWWKKSIVYQIYPRSFYDSNGDGIGDLQGIIQKLDYLKELGVDVIWLSPIYDSPNDDNGYDIRDYYQIMKEFGTMEDLDHLLDAAHQRGLKIIMDLVVNHTSDEHFWFVESKKAQENPYRDYYVWKPGKNGKEPNNWGSIFSGPAWDFDENTNEYYLHLFSKKQPDLNWENPALRNEIYTMMKFWLDKGIDGFRMDVINFISKVPGLPDGEVKEGAIYGDGGPYFVNGPKIHEYLREMNEKVLSNYDILTVGEMPGASTADAVIYTYPDNKEINMIFTFEHMGLDSGPTEKWDLKPLNLVDLKENLTKWQIEMHGTGWNSLYWNNHDQPRIVSRFGDDQEYRVVSAKMLATCLHMMQGTPYIYQGEEIGMTNVKFESIEHYQDVETLNMFREKRSLGVPTEDIMKSIYVKGRDNARTPMQWNEQTHSGFTKGTPWIKVNPRYKEINVEAALADKESIFYHYKHLIALRKKLDVITTGDFNLLFEDHPKLFAYERRSENEKVVVLCNFSRDEIVIEEEVFLTEIAQAELIVQNYKEVEHGKLRPYETLVYYQKGN
ncbi:MULTISPECIES: alpha-glucosidase [unclassified Mesobacillus]|uniref:glycoside hydrolase family 13 protein n=1 Tax=unclassified Mesobacillus TaxID=2675270 RepID=UPI00203DDF26|nr:MULTISPECIES: alpha-glucosidase [unclassified Mesobacillus]MCM3126048.1 alpha-glucosidase [Mesobacillus sp. MER 33]MCM3236039.1 alpha-glucosidase [Mesobacillus sp. MER 48]